jgi:hypothetical protein
MRGLEFLQGQEPNCPMRLDLAERPHGEASDGHRRGKGLANAQHAVQFPRPLQNSRLNRSTPAMCDYSLQHVASRPAKVGDKLVSSQFVNSITRGFAAVGEPKVAVCLLPGTELVFDRNVECDHALGFFPNKKLRENVARFRQINLGNPYEHHDALEFPSGQVVLLTRLCVGQRATVIQLPAGAQPTEGVNEGEVVPEVQRVTFVE